MSVVEWSCAYDDLCLFHCRTCPKREMTFVPGINSDHTYFMFDR